MTVIPFPSPREMPSADEIYEAGFAAGRQHAAEAWAAQVRSMRCLTRAALTVTAAV